MPELGHFRKKGSADIPLLAIPDVWLPRGHQVIGARDHAFAERHRQANLCAGQARRLHHCGSALQDLHATRCGEGKKGTLIGFVVSRAVLLWLLYVSVVLEMASSQSFACNFSMPSCLLVRVS